MTLKVLILISLVLQILQKHVQKNIKLIYLSTSYIYPDKKEITKKVMPYYPLIIMLGQNLVVRQQYKCIKILILRLSMTAKPFIHKKAFTNKTNFIYHDEVVNLLLKLLKNRGIINVVVKLTPIYNFAKKENYKIKNHY